jgi:hypothetical protein
LRKLSSAASPKARLERAPANVKRRGARAADNVGCVPPQPIVSRAYGISRKPFFISSNGHPTTRRSSAPAREFQAGSASFRSPPPGVTPTLSPNPLTELTKKSTQRPSGTRSTSGRVGSHEASRAGTIEFHFEIHAPDDAARPLVRSEAERKLSDRPPRVLHIHIADTGQVI